MEVKWEKWIPADFPPRELLIFRNRALGIKGQPSGKELHAMKYHMAELARDPSLYNLVAIKDGVIAAWMSGKFSERRLTDIIRSIFFDTQILANQEIDDLLYQLEISLPYPFHRIEIHGLGPGRESDIKLVTSSGYRPDYCIIFSHRTVESQKPPLDNENPLEFDHNIYPHTAFDIYRNAFTNTWDRDEIEQSELKPILDGTDERFSFIAYNGESPAGMVLTNKGLNDDEAYLQVIAVQPRMSGARIADSMMNHLEEKLIKNGIKSLSLAAYSDNRQMGRFLDRWHFTELYRETVFIKDEPRRSADFHDK